MNGSSSMVLRDKGTDGSTIFLLTFFGTSHYNCLHNILLIISILGHYIYITSQNFTS